MKRFLLLLLAPLLALASAQTHTVRLALDWVPNTNHTGIYVALAQGWYEEAGVDLEILPYGSVSPEALVTSGQAEVAVSSTEGVLTSVAGGEPVVSVAAILSTNTAALAVLKESGITRPRDLDGKVYAAFGGPYETPTIRSIIQHDGGTGEFKSALLNVAGFDALLAGRADFVWIFEGWQGVQAEREGIELTLFNFNDYGIPDYYTPNLVSSVEAIENEGEALRAFMAATSRGYTFAAENPEEAAELLLEAAPAGSFPDPDLVRDSQQVVSQHYIAEGEPWGHQRPVMWQGYQGMLLDAGVYGDKTDVLREALEDGSLYTNELLPQ
jgi:ABC-type nitrate/sulfonate/bicarbonate transport system substrate-binding protein